MKTNKKNENRRRKSKNTQYDNEKLKPVLELIEKQNHYRALSYIEDYLDTNPNDYYAFYLKAKVLYYLNNNEMAKKTLQTIEDNCDISSLFFKDAYCLLMGDILKQDKEYDKMLEYYQEVYEAYLKKSLTEKMFISVKKIIDYYIQIKDKENAIKFSNKLPNLNTLVILKANMYLFFKEYEKYEYYLNLFQEDNCNNNTALNLYYCLKANYLRINKHPYEALKVLKKYNEKYKTYRILYIEEKILSLVLIKDFENAYKYISKLPENKKPTFLYEYYMKKYNFSAAYQEVIKIENENIKLQKIYDYYYCIGDFINAEKISCKLLSYKCDTINLVKFLNCSLRIDSFEQFKIKYTILEEYLNTEEIPVRLLGCYAKKEHIIEDKSTYSEKQIINYDKNEAIKHIKNHHGENSVFISYFDKNSDIEKLFNEISCYIKDKKPYYSNIYDKYIIHTEDIKMSSIYHENLNDIAIITLPNTKNIITMYPVDMVDEDLNEIENEEKPKTKRLTQIDKFNKRYGTST